MSVLTGEEREGGVRLITLRRPKVNAFDIELMTALSEAMVEAGQQKEIRAVVVTGEGSVFSGGLDFKELFKASMGGPAGAAQFGDAMRQAFIDFWTCPRPTVAAVNGSAIAAGFLIAIACDFRFVTEDDGKYGLNEVTFGAGFPPIAIELGRYVLGRHMPEAILEGELYDWRVGLENGTFNHSVPADEDVVERALEHAKKLGAYPQEAYAHVKAQLIEPYMRVVNNETDEHKAKTASIFTTIETVEALMKYASGVMEW